MTQTDEDFPFDLDSLEDLSPPQGEEVLEPTGKVTEKVTAVLFAATVVIFFWFEVYVSP